MSITVKNITDIIERMAPLYYQEGFDNAGLIAGSPDMPVTAALLCFDVTEAVIDEAIERNANLVISHHPPVFAGMKRFNGNSATERIVMRAIRHDLALYAAHTNLDSARGGINTTLAKKIGLNDIEVLQPKEGLLYKIVTFVPTAYSGKVRDALFAADAGHIGNYDSCSYSLDGTGTFRADKNTRPFVGKKDELHTEPETRIETVVRRDGINAAVAALLQSHPYEEPAYDIYPLENRFEGAGLGAYGVLPQPVDAQEIFDVLREKLSVKVIRHNALFKKVQTIAVCGGAGANLTDRALSVKADMLITGDCKYHNFVDLQNRIILADAGHFESEYFAVEILYDVIIKNLSNFAVYFAQGIENPVQYYF